MIIAIIGRKTGQNDSAHKNLSQLITSFSECVLSRGHSPMIEKETHSNFIIGPNKRLTQHTFSAIGKTADVVLVFGGDGTMMHAVKELSVFGVPLLGINLGRLGFITDVPHDFNHHKIIDMLECGNRGYSVEFRQMLDVLQDWPNEKARYLAMNEVLISRSTGKVIEFEVYIDDEYAYQARGDGLMISTPTGSTAYAMSAGGPIIHPSARVMELVPVMPQTLSCRPLIINDTSQVTFKLISGSAEVLIDGNEVATMNTENALQPIRNSIIIKKSLNEAQFIHPKLDDLTYSYYNTLREKLNWQHLPGTPR